MSEPATPHPMADSAPAPPVSERPRKGLGKLVYDLRHRRRRFRQLMGAVLVLVLTLAGDPAPLLLAVGAVIVVVGMMIRLWASGFVMKNEVLATVGPYGFVRHPLYVGNLTIALGFCLASGVWWSYPLTLVVLLVFYPDAIRYEDRKLDRLFPGSWSRWSQQTRALLPRLSPYPGEGSDEASRWSLRRSMMRNGEPIHIAVGFACLAYLFWQLP